MTTDGDIGKGKTRRARAQAPPPVVHGDNRDKVEDTRDARRLMGITRGRRATAKGGKGKYHTPRREWPDKPKRLWTEEALALQPSTRRPNVEPGAKPLGIKGIRANRGLNLRRAVWNSGTIVPPIPDGATERQIECRRLLEVEGMTQAAAAAWLTQASGQAISQQKVYERACQAGYIGKRARKSAF